MRKENVYMPDNLNKGGPAPATQGTGNQVSVEPEPTQGAGNQPTYITEEKLAQILQAHDDKYFTERVQPFVDKSRDNTAKMVQSEVASIKSSLEAAGIQVTPQQQQAIQQAVINKVLTQVNEPNNQEQPPATPAGDEPSDPIVIAAERLQQEANIWLEDDDPEVKAINYDNDTAFLTSVQQAIQTKKARLGEEAKQTATRVTPGLSGGGGTAGTYVGRKSMDLLTEAYQPKS